MYFKQDSVHHKKRKNATEVVINRNALFPRYIGKMYSCKYKLSNLYKNFKADFQVLPASGFYLCYNVSSKKILFYKNESREIVLQ